MDNLSALAGGSLTANSSMQGGNTASVAPFGAPPGSPSEAYADVQLHDEPEPDLGETWTAANRQDGGDALAGHGFTYPDAEGDGWHGTRP